MTRDDLIAAVRGEPSADDAAVVAAVIWTAAIGGLLHRRTRGAATLTLAVLLSRAHGAHADRVDETILRLFDERTSTQTRIAALDRRLYGEHGIVDEHDARIADVEAIIAGQYGAGPPLARPANAALRRLADRLDRVVPYADAPAPSDPA